MFCPNSLTLPFISHAEDKAPSAKIHTRKEKQATGMVIHNNRNEKDRTSVSLRLFTDLPATLLERLLTYPSLHAWDLTSLYQAANPLYPTLCEAIQTAAELLLFRHSTGKNLIIHPLPTSTFSSTPAETPLSALRFLHSIPASSSSSCVESSVWSCGRNDFSQGVRMSTADTNTLQPCLRVPSDNYDFTQPPAKVVSIAAGGTHSACVTESGTLFVAGANGRGELGIGNNLARNAWEPITQLKNQGGRIAIVACGHSHTAVVTADGALFITGANSSGQLGVGDLNDRFHFHHVSLPPLIKSHEKGNEINMKMNNRKAFEERDYRRSHAQPVMMVSAGLAHTVCLLRDGSVYASGDNHHGQLCTRHYHYSHSSSPSTTAPNRKLLLNSTTFQRVNLHGHRVKRIACGPDSTMLLTAANMVLVTGKRPNGALSVIGGLGGRSTQISHLSVGERFAVVRTNSGAVGLSVYRKRFRVPDEFVDFCHGGTRAVAAGAGHYAVVCEDGSVRAAGKNAFGQVAAGEMGLMFQGSMNARIVRTCSVPLSKVVSVPEGYEVLQVAAGCFHSLYLLAKKTSNSTIRLEDN